jgi:hypothetical protein
VLRQGVPKNEGSLLCRKRTPTLAHRIDDVTEAIITKTALDDKRKGVYTSYRIIRSFSEYPL